MTHHMIECILSDACDGPAIAYWAKGKDIVRKAGEINYVHSFKVADNDPDGSGPVKKGWKLIDEKAIMKAREKIVNEDVGIHRSIAAQFVGPIDKWEYDSDGVDALIQVAFFGKIVYG